jgi:phenylpyruvate tautomerase PptA (4-oxalocrotonate tautomerase family)
VTAHSPSSFEPAGLRNTRRRLLKRIRELFQEATGASDYQIVLGIQEVPPSQAMEMGQIMPDVANQ